MKPSKRKRLKKVKSILDEIKKEDIKKLKGNKPRSLDVWFGLINLNLTPTEKFRNKRALSSIFRSFNFKKETEESRDVGCFRRITYYQYIGGFKNGASKGNKAI